MAQGALTEPLRVYLALQAAAYIRWAELRTGQSPSTQSTQQFIEGMLDGDGFDYDSDEPRLIEVLALATPPDQAEEFGVKTGFFRARDSVQKAKS